jgi:hypothetical protein
MSAYHFTTEAQVRNAFWTGFPQFIKRRGWRQNQYTAVIREEWVNFVDMLQKDGHISEALTNRVTL